MPEIEVAKDRKGGKPGRALWWAAAFVVAAVIGFAPGWWERRLFQQAQDLAGAGAPIRPGKLADARAKIDPGKTAEQIRAALGEPSLRSSTEAVTPREIWTYYYQDGTLVVNLSGGVAQRVSVSFGPPAIPSPRHI